MLLLHFHILITKYLDLDTVLAMKNKHQLEDRFPELIEYLGFTKKNKHSADILSPRAIPHKLFRFQLLNS